MWVSWTLISLVQIYLTRYLKHRWRWNKLVHSILGVFSLTLLITAGFLALHAKDWKIESTLHAKAGLAMFIIGLVYMISGLAAIYVRLFQDIDWGKSKFVRYVGKVHKYFGIAVLIGMQFAMFTGVLYYSKNYGEPHLDLALAIISPILFTFGVVVGEVFYRVQLRKRTGFDSHEFT